MFSTFNLTFFPKPDQPEDWPVSRFILLFRPCLHPSVCPVILIHLFTPPFFLTLYYCRFFLFSTRLCFFFSYTPGYVSIFFLYSIFSGVRCPFLHPSQFTALPFSTLLPLFPGILFVLFYSSFLSRTMQSFRLFELQINTKRPVVRPTLAVPAVINQTFYIFGS